VWTLKAQGKKASAGVDFDAAKPSYAHMALKVLVDAGLLKSVVSQNVDGLHVRSGIPLARLWQVHGDSHLTVCWTKGCGHSQLHPLRQRTAFPERAGGKCRDCVKRVKHFCHCVADKCPKCGESQRGVWERVGAGA
jgi:NAD+-dependent protein deacetylase sirtuin 6